MTVVEPVEGAARAGVYDVRTGPRSQIRQPRRHAGSEVAWPALLDALEERTRRLADVIKSGEEAEVPEPALAADGPLPDHLELRARVLLAETERLARRAEQRKAATERELRYRAS